MQMHWQELYSREQRHKQRRIRKWRSFFFFIPTRLWRWNSVPKRRHIKFRRRKISQKKAYHIQNKAKVWNQELLFLLTEHSAKEARFDCRNERVSYNTISNVSYLHLWQALPHTTPFSLSFSRLHCQQKWQWNIPLNYTYKTLMIL